MRFLWYNQLLPMEPFLYNVAKRLWDSYKGELDQVLVVFNNRRAGLFLQNHLKSMDSRPFFLPRIIGIDDLVNELSNCPIVPHEFLLFELFDIHRSLEGVERRFETFEEFMNFGEMMVRDFSELDLYCVDVKKIFENLHDLKRLGEWDIGGQPLTSFQEKYLNFYKSLYLYYSRLRQRLQEQGRAYTGMAYRTVAEQIETLADTLNYKHIYFVGFNALSNCELKIINCLVRQGKASVIFDGDSFYFDDKSKEAGLFLRRHASMFPNADHYENHFAEGKRTIHIVNCPENTLQAKVAGLIIGGLQTDRTAVVLADESLLLPMLNSLPENVVSTNVTMGFPYIFSNTHNLVSKLLSLYSRSRDDGFYHTDIVSVLSDHLIERCIGADNLHSTAEAFIYDKKIIRLTTDDIRSLLHSTDHGRDILFLFETECPSVNEILALLRKTAELLENSTIFSSNNKEKESLASLLQTIDYLDELQQNYSFIETTETLQRIYQHLAQRCSVAFYGEPLHGMQLLGMLETRSLDFSNIIITSVNEGILPAGRNENSLIPLSLKRAFGLPTFEEKDAVYAYHFFRLIQRADNVWLIYNSDDEGMGKGEPSRYIMQVINELAPQYQNIDIKEEAVSAFSSPRNHTPIQSVKKDSRILQRLEALAANGLSPSMLNRYRNCPLQFYFGDLIGAAEQDEMSEEVMANELGTFIHAILCRIHEPYKGTTLPVEALEKALESLDDNIANTLKDNLLKGRSREGKNHIYGEVAKMQISNFLKNEIQFLKDGHELKMVMTEDGMAIRLDGVGNNDSPVVINGFVDRVDTVDGILRIIDYKSGKVTSKDLCVDEAVPDTHKVPDKWFQVMTYAWLFFNKHPEYRCKHFLSGIYPLRALKSGFMPASWEKEELMGSKQLDGFGDILKTLVDEMLNPEIDLIATDDKDNCQYCPYKQSCHKNNF